MNPKVRQARGTGIVVVASLFWAIVAPVAPNRVDASEPARGVPWPATDALGRSLPMAGDRGVPAPRADRYVGMFYFLWHNDPRGKPPAGSGPYDVSQILAREPDALATSRLAALGPAGDVPLLGRAALRLLLLAPTPGSCAGMPSSSRRPGSTS